MAMMASSAAFASEPGLDHAAWDALVRHYVDGQGRVDYRAWRDEGWEALERYLQRLAEVDVSRLDHDAALAFWINAYNACVVQGVLEHYPINSVKDVPGFFGKITYRIGKDSLTLNEIEGRGRKLGDWRVHFAVVCASVSCPSLVREAYLPERLDKQLAEQARRFLADPQRGLRVEGRTLWLSKIFDWYKADFVPAGELGWLGRFTPEKLLLRIEPYVDRHTAQVLRSQQLSIKFLDYNWSLNAQHK